MASTKFQQNPFTPKKNRNIIPKMKPEKMEKKKEILVKSFAHKQFKIINKMYCIKIQIRFFDGMSKTVCVGG